MLRGTPIFTEIKINEVKLKVIENFGESYKFLKILGEGAHGITGLYNGPYGQVAIKIIDFDLAKYKNQINEIRILKSLVNYPFYIKYYDSFLIRKKLGHKLAVVMKYINGITLNQFINNLKQKNELIHPKTLLSIAIWICNCVYILHSHNIAHRDIKPDNIMLADDKLYLIDFGLSIELSSYQVLNQKKEGTPFYMAPEVLQKKVVDFKKSDLWSIGVTLFYLTELRFPWNSKNIDDLTVEVSSFNKNIPTRYPNKHISKYILSLLSPNSNDRPSLENLYIIFSKLHNS